MSFRQFSFELVLLFRFVISVFLLFYSFFLFLLFIPSFLFLLFIPSFYSFFLFLLLFLLFWLGRIVCFSFLFPPLLIAGVFYIFKDCIWFDCLGVVFFLFELVLLFRLLFSFFSFHFFPAFIPSFSSLVYSFCFSFFSGLVV